MLSHPEPVPLDQPQAAPVLAWCAQLACCKAAELPRLDYLRAGLDRDPPELVCAILGKRHVVGAVSLSPLIPFPRVVGSAAGRVPIGSEPIWRVGGAFPVVIAVGVRFALVLAGARPRAAKRLPLYAVVDADALRGVWLPASVRRLVVWMLIEDESFGDRPTLEQACERLRAEGRDVLLSACRPGKAMQR
jgi:hypothetical protein